MNGNGNGFGPAALILALGLGIALIIFAGNPRAHGQEVTAPVTTEFRAVLTNLQTGHKGIYTGKSWSSALACEQALGNLPSQLAALADPDPEVKAPDSAGVDPDLDGAVFELVFRMFQSTGVPPHLSIACELQGDPA